MAHPNRTHGGSRTLEYGLWNAMKSRCYNPAVACYPDYGGRGIQVCDVWRHDFGAFMRDMGPRPSLNHSVERLDNDGHYEPSNCRWATRQEQANNTRWNRRITAFGRTLTLTQWSRELGRPPQTLCNRLKHRSPESALTAQRLVRSDKGKSRTTSRA